MKTKKVTKSIETEVYVTEDGTEFSDYEEASVYEKTLIIKSRFGEDIEERMISSFKNIYFTVRNQQELSDLLVYTKDILNLYTQVKFSIDDLKYPAIIYFNKDCQFYEFTNDMYNSYKTACDMYEKIIT